MHASVQREAHGPRPSFDSRPDDDLAVDAERGAVVSAEIEIDVTRVGQIPDAGPAGREEPAREQGVLLDKLQVDAIGGSLEDGVRADRPLVKRQGQTRREIGVRPQHD